MSFIRPSAPSTVWKTFGATLRAWNGTRLSHAPELTCSGGRAGCSASRKELHATRVPPQEMKSPLPPMDNSPHRFFCRGSRAGCINQNGAGNSRSLFESSTPPRDASLFRPLRAISSAKLSLRLKSPPLPQEMERWLPQASRSSTRLRK